MTRVVAGAARGRRLDVPGGRSTRPTADRTREALFSALESMIGSFAGRRVADLFAGSGAVGLEALSRGAAHCLLVESDRAALRALRANVAALALPGARVLPARVESVVAAPPGPAAPADGPGEGGGRTTYDVVFLDPPYDLGDDRLREVVAALLAHDWLAPQAVVVAERATRGAPWHWPPGIVAHRSRRYGEATLWYGRAAQPEPSRPDGQHRPGAGE